MKIGYHTLGCKVNQYETEAIIEIFEKRGYETVEFDDVADIYLINTCTVTNAADKKSRQMLSKAKKKNEQAIIVAVGCYAQIAESKLKENNDIDLIIGNTKKNEVADLVEAYLLEHNKMSTVEDMSHLVKYEELWLSKVEDKKRAHIKIQDGCNQFCSYCIIPFTRGRVRSRSGENILNEVKGIVTNGYKEIVLTGIHLASYGIEFDNYKLIDLLEELNCINGLERIRLGSLEPTIITDEFVNRLKVLDKICTHFHLSLQSGCDSILKKMNRKYTTTQYFESVKLLRNAFDNPAITTDIIVGFPSETDEEFETTLSFVKAVAFSDIHIFKYSKREGTTAANMKEQINEKIKNDRSKVLTSLRDELLLRYLNLFLQKNVLVLFEEMIVLDGKTYAMGHTPNYLKVLITTEKMVDNTILPVFLEEIKQDYIFGHLL